MLKVSQAAERSMCTTPVTFLFSRQSLMNYIRLSICLVVELPGQKLACSEISSVSTAGSTLLSMNRLKSFMYGIKVK